MDFAARPQQRTRGAPSTADAGPARRTPCCRKRCRRRWCRCGPRTALGRTARTSPCAHLRDAGLTILDRNWRCDIGEIDIVARDGDAAGRLRGEDPVERRVRRARSRPSRPARPRGCAGWPPGGWPSDTCTRREHPHRRRRRAARPAAAPPRSSTSAGCSDGRSRRTRAVALVGRPGAPRRGRGRPRAAAARRSSLIGLPDASLRESRDRVRAAVRQQRPALAARDASPSTCRRRACPSAARASTSRIAVAVLAAAGRCRRALVDAVVRSASWGSTAGSGRCAACCRRGCRGRRRASSAWSCPAANAAEARLVPGMRVTGRGSLRELVALLRRAGAGARRAATGDSATPAVAGRPGAPGEPDLADVLGQADGAAAIEVAAAGRPPRAAARAAGRRQDDARRAAARPAARRSTREAALEVTAVHSVAGTLPPGTAAGDPAAVPGARTTPRRSPAIVGGGCGITRPGAASLAHRGVLFLDEAPEFAPARARRAAPAARSRASHRVAARRRQALFPARFQLVLAANPCPCGKAGGPGHGLHAARRCPARYLGAAVRPAARPRRPAASSARRPPAPSCWPTPTSRTTARSSPRGCWRRGSGWPRRLAGTPWRTQRPGAGPRLRRALAAARGPRRALPTRARPRRAHGRAATAGCCGWRGRSPTWRAATGPAGRGGVALRSRGSRGAAAGGARMSDASAEARAARPAPSRLVEPERRGAGPLRRGAGCRGRCCARSAHGTLRRRPARGASRARLPTARRRRPTWPGCASVGGAAGRPRGASRVADAPVDDLRARGAARAVGRAATR